MLFARSPGYLRLAMATLALLGQLTPVVAVPITALTVSPQHSTIGGCAASASCTCSPLDRATSGCCCSKHNSEPAAKPVENHKTKKMSCCEESAKPKRKSCCELTKPEKSEPELTCKLATHQPLAEPAAKIISGGKCRCAKPKSSATSEPAMPPFKAVAVSSDSTSQPNLCYWAAITTVNPLPPPSPPPRS